MGTTYSWHKGAIRVNPVWVASTDIQPDEIFSSWLVRSALINGCDPMTLTWDIWPRWRVWTTDIDRGPPLERLAPLSRLSGIPTAQLQLTTLHSIASSITAPPSPNSVWPWILAIGARGSSRRSGQQYCPQCLKEDHKPFFRIQWRFGWHTVCSKHGHSLLDRCPACHLPIQPHQLKAESRIITLCPKCGMDLRKAKSHEAHPNLLALQIVADSVVANRCGPFGNHALSVAEWFELAYFFSLLTRRFAVAATNAHKQLANIFNLTDLHTCTPPRKDRIEMLRIHDRQLLLKGVAVIMKKGPDFLQEAMVKAKASRQSLCPKGVALPRILNPIFERLPDNPLPRNRKRSVKSYPPKPTPRHLVEKRMRHIMRLVKEQEG